VISRQAALPPGTAVMGAANGLHSATRSTVMVGLVPTIYDFIGLLSLKSWMTRTGRFLGRAFGPRRGPAMTEPVVAGVAAGAAFITAPDEDHARGV
jgi:hypothetical protein